MILLKLRFHSEQHLPRLNTASGANFKKDHCIDYICSIHCGNITDLKTKLKKQRSNQPTCKKIKLH